MTTPPADLHLDMQDILHHALGMDWSFDADNDAIADAVSDFFAALSEWMGDSLVDRTWTRWDRGEVAWEWDDCDRPLIGTSWTERSDLPDDPGDLPLYTLTPRED